MKPKAVLSFQAIAAVIAFGLVPLFGCAESPTAPAPVVNVYVNQLNDSQNGASTPTPGGQGCAPVASVGASARDASFTVVGTGNTPGILRVGQTYSLDATPKDAGGNVLESHCHAPTGQWTADPAVGRVKLLGNTQGFNPQLLVDGTVGPVTITFTLGQGAGSGQKAVMTFEVK